MAERQDKFSENCELFKDFIWSGQPRGGTSGHFSPLSSNAVRTEHSFGNRSRLDNVREVMNVLLCNMQNGYVIEYGDRQLHTPSFNQTALRTVHEYNMNVRTASLYASCQFLVGSALANPELLPALRGALQVAIPEGIMQACTDLSEPTYMASQLVDGNSKLSAFSLAQELPIEQAIVENLKQLYERKGASINFNELLKFPEKYAKKVQTDISSPVNFESGLLQLEAFLDVWKAKKLGNDLFRGVHPIDDHEGSYEVVCLGKNVARNIYSGGIYTIISLLRDGNTNFHHDEFRRIRFPDSLIPTIDAMHDVALHSESTNKEDLQAEIINNVFNRKENAQDPIFPHFIDS